jgi:hypothetical protein
MSIQSQSCTVLLVVASSSSPSGCLLSRLVCCAYEWENRSCGLQHPHVPSAACPPFSLSVTTPPSRSLRPFFYYTCSRFARTIRSGGEGIAKRPIDSTFTFFKQYPQLPSLLPFRQPSSYKLHIDHKSGITQDKYVVLPPYVAALSGKGCENNLSDRQRKREREREREREERERERKRGYANIYDKSN